MEAQCRSKLARPRDPSGQGIFSYQVALSARLRVLRPVVAELPDLGSRPHDLALVNGQALRASTQRPAGWPAAAARTAAPASGTAAGAARTQMVSEKSQFEQAPSGSTRGWMPKFPSAKVTVCATGMGARSWGRGDGILPPFYTPYVIGWTTADHLWGWAEREPKTWTRPWGAG